MHAARVPSAVGRSSKFELKPVNRQQLRCCWRQLVEGVLAVGLVHPRFHRCRRRPGCRLARVDYRLDSMVNC